GAAPAQDLWEAYARIVSKVSPEFGLITNLFAGTAQANGSDARLIKRYGGDVRVVYKNVKFTGMAKVNDWGPFDYHRDFNLTFPLQLMADVSTTLAKPSWFELPNSRLGLRYTWRSLDRYSPRYCPTTTLNAAGQHVCDPTAVGFGNGREWELQTYLQINISN
ncbi:MAG: glycosidase, partial [Saprospiraceae bacterium]|nr:glycosidase [Saprospiraceae bacterium]